MINDNELDVEVAAKHEIMIQYEGRREIVVEEFAGADYLSAAIQRTEELEQDPKVRFYVVILKIIGGGAKLEEIMMVRDMISKREYKEDHLQ